MFPNAAEVEDVNNFLPNCNCDSSKQTVSTSSKLIHAHTKGVHWHHLHVDYRKTNYRREEGIIHSHLLLSPKPISQAGTLIEGAQGRALEFMHVIHPVEMHPYCPVNNLSSHT